MREPAYTLPTQVTLSTRIAFTDSEPEHSYYLWRVLSEVAGYPLSYEPKIILPVCESTDEGNLPRINPTLIHVASFGRKVTYRDFKNSSLPQDACFTFNGLVKLDTRALKPVAQHKDVLTAFVKWAKANNVTWYVQFDDIWRQETLPEFGEDEW